MLLKTCESFLELEQVSEVGFWVEAGRKEEGLYMLPFEGAPDECQSKNVLNRYKVTKR